MAEVKWQLQFFFCWGRVFTVLVWYSMHKQIRRTANTWKLFNRFEKTPWNVKTHICALNIISAPNSNQILKVKYARFSATYISSSSHSVPRLFCIISQSDPFLEFSFGLKLFGRRSFFLASPLSLGEENVAAGTRPDTPGWTLFMDAFPPAPVIRSAAAAVSVKATPA